MRSQSLASWFGMTSQRVLLLLVAVIALVVLAIAAGGQLGAGGSPASVAQGSGLLSALREAVQFGL